MEDDIFEEVPAQDDGDENPDELAGEEVEPEHDLDVFSFEDEDADVDEDGGDSE